MRLTESVVIGRTTMPFDAAAYLPGHRTRLQSARLNIGLPVPNLEWPKNLFGNEINPRNLKVQAAHPSKISLGKHHTGSHSSAVATGTFEAT
jgi:hypothetical protein